MAILLVARNSPSCEISSCAPHELLLAMRDLFPTRGPSSHGVSTLVHVVRLLLPSHNFLLSTIFPILPHHCAPCDTQLLLNAKSSTYGIAHRSSSAGVVSPSCDTLHPRLSALNVVRVDVQDSIPRLSYCD